MIPLPTLIILGSWLVFVGYWWQQARKVKPVQEKAGALASLAYRLPVMLGFIWMAHRWPGPLDARIYPHFDFEDYLGALICVLGLIITIWARRTLAGNWSSNVTFKKGHELIRSGPYQFVRHPIYTGLLTMCLGGMVTVGRWQAFLGLASMTIGLWIKLKQEEHLMLRHFPEAYLAYRREVKALIPFVW